MNDLEILPYQSCWESDVLAIWQACALIVPQNDPVRDIRLKMAKDPELFLIGCLHEQPVATLMGGYEGHRGWMNYLAVHPAFQRKGYARAMVEAFESKVRSLGCPKVNLQVRETNAQVLAFYRALGYQTDSVVSLGKRF